MPTAATCRLRVTVIRRAVQTWRESGLLTTDLDLAYTGVRRSPADPHPVTPAEVATIRRSSFHRPDRGVASACVASLLAGASQTEAAHIVEADYDSALGTLRLVGRASRQPRTVTIGPEGAKALDRRVELLRATSRRSGESAKARGQVLTLRRPLGDYAPDAVAPAIGNTISRSLRSAGVDRAHITASSLRDYAANRMFSLTGRVEDVALLLGMASLDRARRLIDLEWQSAWSDLAREDEG